MELYDRVRFCGGVWTIVYKENGKLHLTSLDGKQHKRNIHESQVQLIDQFADCYPEE